MKKSSVSILLIFSCLFVFVCAERAGAVSVSSTESSSTYSDLGASSSSSEGSTADSSSVKDESQNQKSETKTTSDSSTANTDEEDAETAITEDTNKAMGDSIKEIYQDESTLSRIRSNIDTVIAGESNRPSSNFIDVSSHNGTISVSNYQKIKSYGITGVVVKATEGTTYSNPYARSQINNALSAGLKVSVYHYAHYTTSAVAQNEAKYFASVVSNLGLAKSVNMVIDIEESKMRNSALNGNTMAFKNALNAVGYGNVYYYMSQSWLSTANGVFSVPTFGAKKIWVAQYPYSPNASQNWNSGNAAWQWSSQFYVPGISHPFDINKDYTYSFSHEINTKTNYYYKNSLSGGEADFNIYIGRASDKTYFGDWNNDSIDTPVFRRQSDYYFRNSNSNGIADMVINYGRATDAVYVGDWDGDGRDTLAVRRGNVYYFKNSFSGGEADSTIVYGRASDSAVVGDWNGDGKDTLAVRRGNEYHFKNSISGGKADSVVVYGKTTDAVYSGDWNGDSKDTLAVRRGGFYYFKNSLLGGEADSIVNYGRSTDEVYFGDWNGDLKDTFVIRR